MNAKDLARTVRLRFETATGVKYPNKDDAERTIENMVQSAVDRVVTASANFEFAIGEKTHTVISTESNPIQLKGGNSDCRDVYTILWGTTKKLLYRYTDYEKDLSFSGTTVSGAPTGWVRRGVKSGFPQIEFVGAIATADVFTYRYLKKNITIENWPSEWVFVLEEELLSQLNDGVFGRRAFGIRKQMIDFYNGPHKGGVRSLAASEIISSNVYNNTKRNIG